ncbi:integrin alpha-E isoform X7 [Chrysemys picta bellii]|uniref:integrin alpha-E isoform X7 n=1 Tax=Chrysemys picta bellii TaxID=8478 RepID=UPI0032B132D3
MDTSKPTYKKPGLSQNRLIGLIETDDSIQEGSSAAGKQGENKGAKGGKEKPPLETPYKKESSDFEPKIKINLNYRPGLSSNSQKDPNRFDRDRLFGAVSRGNREELDGLLDYLSRTSKFLSDSRYTDAETGKTCLMKALLNLKDGTNPTIPRLLEIDQKTENPRPLVNAACTNSYYAGQTALHIAIEKRHLDLVKLLVENGADVHARAHGEFFRKKKGGVCFYFGELPLSLAACTNQFDVIKYLLDNPYQKARLQEQDSLGNTVLHALVVIADDTKQNTELVCKMYDEILKAGTKINPAEKLEEIVNQAGLTPLKLAAKKGKVEIFRHILQREIKDPEYRHLSRKFTEWTYGPVHVSLYDLSSVDSYEKNSVLEILAESSDTPNRYKMVVLEPLNKLLQHKWDSFAARRFYLSFFCYFIFMAIFTVLAYHRPLQLQSPFRAEFTAVGFLQLTGQIIVFLGGFYLIIAQILYFLRRWRNLKNVFSDGCIEVFLLLQAFSLLLSAVLYIVGSEDYVPTMVFSLLLGWVNMLYYTRGFQWTGIYCVMIQKTILRDLLRFLMVYVIFLFGFAAALVTLTGDAPPASQNTSVTPEDGDKGHVVYSGLLSTSLELFKFTIGMGDLEFQEHVKFKYFVMLLLLLFVILTYILLLNMLIALMSETVTNVSGYSKSVWKLQRAIAILEIEKSWLWCPRRRQRSGCFLSVSLDDKKDMRWCFRVEEINWANWEKELGVIKEDPGNSRDLEIESLAVTPLSSFNIDTRKKWITPPTAPLSWPKVLQHSDGRKTWVLATSSVEDDPSRQLGRLNKCSLTSDELHCEEVVPRGNSQKSKNIQDGGIAIARSAEWILACLQKKRRRALSITEELNGICTLLTADFQEEAFLNLGKIIETKFNNRDQNNNNNNNNNKINITDTDNFISAAGNSTSNNSRNSHACKADSGTEIAIVLDGSGSIEPEDFERAKGFIFNMMTSFWRKCPEVTFAVVQYGAEIRTEFDLQESSNKSSVLSKVHNITQLGSVTKTASALQHVLDEIFNENRGSVKGARRMILVMTDGEIFLDPLNLTDVMSSLKMATIERYVLGVGEAFNKSKALNELKLIATDPDESHLFRVTNYSALDGLLSTLQQKIIAIEGTAGDITEYELAQTGFSAQILDKQHILVGAVGAYDWSGGVLLYDWVTKMATFLNESKEAKEAKYGYLGYSVAVVNAQDGAWYVAGAPKHSMTGKVLVFKKDGSKQILQGDQVGSYFGSELCSVDVNQDGETDYLLVGAPLYHIYGEEGRVYVYRLQNGYFSWVGHLSVQTPSPFARFGFTVASIGDISRDGYADIAVGAPLEDRLSDSSTFGSIYIYNGDKNGIRSTFSQRIRAAEVAPGLQYFGQSIDGGFDFTDDGLIDITVGSFGNVTVLRSRPVVRFNVTMRFTPEGIFVFHNNSIITAELCFNMSSPLEVSPQETWHLPIRYTVDLDVRMKKKRAHFEDQKSTLSQEKQANGPVCAELLLNILPCDYDCFSSITLKVSYQLSNSNENMDHPAPILDKYQEPEAYFQLSYKKDCNNKAICAANLTLRSQTQKKLVVGDTKELTMDISLVNSGDDSYMTTLVLKYPRNLQFKKMIPEPSSTVIHCDQPKPSAHLLSSMGCKIGHPIFKNTMAYFSVIWQLDEALFPDQTANITINVTNVNENSTALIEEHILDVRYALTAILTKPTPVVYVNVSQGHFETKEFQFNINGENRYGAQIDLEILVPVCIQGHPIARMKNVTGTQNTTVCTNWKDLEYHPQFCTEKTKVQASKGQYQHVHCAITSDRENVTVIAELPLIDSQQFLKDRTDLLVIGEITFNKHLYEGLKEENHKAEITVVLLKTQVINALPVVIGSSVGGFLLLAFIIFILFKCGFFKRNYKNMMEEQHDS